MTSLTNTAGESTTSENGDDDRESRTAHAVVARLDELTPGSMKMADVEGTKVALIRTESGVHALDNACPHQGYGLVTGALDGETVTCQWHNWKFDVATGRCLVGEEDVACHPVSIENGEVSVTVTRPTAHEERTRLWPSLRRGLADDYTGQIARDTVRLLAAGAAPGEIMAEAMAATVPKADYGVGHEMAMAADCLALTEVRTGDDRALPLVQGLSGLAETTRDRPVTDVPAGDASIDLAAAIEAEDVPAAMASVAGQLEGAVDDREAQRVLRHRFLEAVSAHHLSYGHGIIYTQKSFELVERIGWDRAAEILPYLAERIAYSTREDTLPYMRPAMREIEAVDIEALAAAPDRRETGWRDPGLVPRLLASSTPPIEAAVSAVHDGAGIEGLLDAISTAVSYRLLNHDLDVELDIDEPFGWLDITHGLTTARAVRWAWQADPGPQAARLALFATWLLYDTGRSERRHHRAEGWLDGLDGVDATLAGAERGGSTGSSGPSSSADDVRRDLASALLHRRADDAVAVALAGPRATVAETVAEAALGDRAGSFIVTAHLIKTAVAAAEEAETIGSPLPLAAAARYLAAPRLERFVARNVAESVDFVRTGRPPRR